MNPTDWDGNLYVGKTYPPGYRIEILSAEEESIEPPLHFSGGEMDGAVKEVLCPNCTKPLFPVFRLSLADPRVADLGLWNQSSLQLLSCPFCGLYMEPYWVCFHSTIEVIGGERDGGQLLNPYINLPYDQRRIRLVALRPSDFPSTEETCHAHRTRAKPPGVYHQIGGVPFRYSKMACCKCKQPMIFAGIIDDDDLNVPLYEGNRQPVALVIGDNDRLYFFTCVKCHIIGLQWIY
jgi:hypothetical protein